MIENDGWNYRSKPTDYGDCRKLVTLEDQGMIWIGIRAWHNIEKRWYNGNEPERCNVRAWREMPEIAGGGWERGKLQIPAPAALGSGAEHGGVNSSGWRPIESAPKDRDSFVDIWCVSDDRADEWRETGCWWNADRKLWCNHHIRISPSNVTHWMPRPDPPTSADQPTPEAKQERCNHVTCQLAGMHIGNCKFAKQGSGAGEESGK